MKINKCIDCKKPVSIKSRNTTKRCKQCYLKFLSSINKTGKNNPMFGRKGKLNPNYKNGLRSDNKPKCQICNKELGNYYAKLCQKCYFNTLKNKGNPNWQNGISFEPYSFEFTEKYKEKIRNRDNYECQNCGMTEKKHLKKYNDKLNIHHIDYNKENCSENNLITLCYKCNSRANYNRDYWYAYFRYVMENK